MTSASCASLTETSLNDLESSVHSATTTASGARRRGKRKTRTSPSGSRAAQSDVTSQVDSADDAEEIARRAHFGVGDHGDEDDDDEIRRTISVLKRTRRRRLNSSSYVRISVGV